MLKPLQEADFPAAAQLLSEGFPARDRDFWHTGLHTLQARGYNNALGLPLGWLMFDGSQPVAVALTPASDRYDHDGRREILVNVASWYMRSSVRWRAAPMLRAMLGDGRSTCIDVSASEEVSRMLTMLGFRAVNTGTVFAGVAGHAWRPSRGVDIRELRAEDELPPGSPPREQIDRHRDLGCIPLLLEHGATRTLLIYRAHRMRGLPVARLLFIGSHQELHRHFGAPARYFLARRFVFLSWDRRAHTPASRFNVLKSGGIWYARGGDFEDRTDFIGTELSLLNV